MLYFIVIVPEDIAWNLFRDAKIVRKRGFAKLKNFLIGFW